MLPKADFLAAIACGLAVCGESCDPGSEEAVLKLAAKYDVEAPVEFVFAQLIDFEGWERAAMRRGADVSRTDKLTKAGPGMSG